jgi:hypothetical protein
MGRGRELTLIFMSLLHNEILSFCIGVPFGRTTWALKTPHETQPPNRYITIMGFWKQVRCYAISAYYGTSNLVLLGVKLGLA